MFSCQCKCCIAVGLFFVRKSVLHYFSLPSDRVLRGQYGKNVWNLSELWFIFGPTTKSFKSFDFAVKISIFVI